MKKLFIGLLGSAVLMAAVGLTAACASEQSEQHADNRHVMHHSHISAAQRTTVAELCRQPVNTDKDTGRACLARLLSVLLLRAFAQGDDPSTVLVTLTAMAQARKLRGRTAETLADDPQQAPVSVDRISTRPGLPLGLMAGTI